MDKKIKNTILFTTGDYIEQSILTTNSANTAIMFEDSEYLAVLFDVNMDIIKDIVAFSDYNPEEPNEYLCRKYNITNWDTMFDEVGNLETWFGALVDLDVLSRENIGYSYEYPLETAISELFFD